MLRTLLMLNVTVCLAALVVHIPFFIEIANEIPGLSAYGKFIQVQISVLATISIFLIPILNIVILTGGTVRLIRCIKDDIKK